MWVPTFKFASDHKQCDYQELEKVEQSRRELLIHSKWRYRRHTYLKLWGTVIPSVSLSWEWWLSLGVYCMARLLLYLNIADSTTLAVDARYMTVIGGFISFLLVFYNNQGYSRYTSQYELSMRMEGRIYNISLLAKDHLPTAI